MSYLSNGHYLNEIKLHRHKTGRMILPRSVKITPEGRYIVEHEPNLEDSTLTALRDTDWELLSVEDRIRVSSLSEKQLVEYAFFEHGEIGLTHLTQCVSDNKDQTMAELVVRYATERRMSFLLAAILIKALSTQQSLFYYHVTPHDGFKRVKWEPKTVYIPPDALEPPAKKHRRVRKKPLTTIPKPRKYDLALCPVCQSPAKLYRCGGHGLFWHVCCLNPNCENYIGLEPMKTERKATIAWNTYVKKML